MWESLGGRNLKELVTSISRTRKSTNAPCPPICFLAFSFSF